MSQEQSFSGDTSDTPFIVDGRDPLPFPQSHHNNNNDSYDSRYFPSGDWRSPSPFPTRRRGYSGSQFSPATGDVDPTRQTDTKGSCCCFSIFLWFIANTLLIMGIYGPTNLQLGPNSSVLIKPNPFFVKNIKVEEMDDAKNRPTLYGVYGNPSLDGVATFYEAYKTSLPASTHKEWVYYLNQGSQINISYSVDSSSSYSVVLIIAQGSDGLAKWLEKPSSRNSALSWNLIDGNGTISQDIGESSSYYVAVGNLNTGVVQVRLYIGSRALFYNTTDAYYKCELGPKRWSTKFSFPHGKFALLTSPPQRPGTATAGWSIRVSYGHRWITFLGIAGVSLFIFLVYWYLNGTRSSHQKDVIDASGLAESQQTSLLSRKDDLASCGSSYDGLSKDVECNDSNIGQQCAVCFDAPRDCFFIPCGHSVSCFACGTRIAEAAGTCPVCRSHTKKVGKIYTA